MVYDSLWTMYTWHWQKNNHSLVQENVCTMLWLLNNVTTIKCLHGQLCITMVKKSDIFCLYLLLKTFDFKRLQKKHRKTSILFWYKLTWWHVWNKLIISIVLLNDPRMKNVSIIKYAASFYSDKCIVT